MNAEWEQWDVQEKTAQANKRRIESLSEPKAGPSKELKWIDVKDRLPDQEVFEVLVKFDEPFFGVYDPRMAVCYYAHDLCEWHCEFKPNQKIHHVTHWMLLPEPPVV